MSYERRLRLLPLLALPLALLALAGPSAAQQAPARGFRAELLRDVEQLEDRYLALAEVMTEHYGWRPGEGVRSVSEVLMHVASANFSIPAMVGVAPSQASQLATMPAMEKITDPALVKEALQASFAHVKHAIATTPDDQLDASTQLFGREATKRAVLHLLVTHMHEHLGQSIAYARMTGVVPPWSG